MFLSSRAINRPDWRDGAVNAGQARMRLKLCVIMALTFSCMASGQSVTNTTTKIEAQLAEQEAALKLVRQETISVLSQQHQLDGSAALREDEARSLHTRFRAIRLSQRPSSAEFVSALRSEEQRMLSEHSDTLWRMNVALRERQCEALRKLERDAAGLENDPSWPLLSLEERTAARTVIAEGRRQAYASGDPCILQARPTQPASMLGKQ